MKILIKFVLIPALIVSSVLGIGFKTYEKWGPRLAETKKKIQEKRINKKNSTKKAAKAA